MTFFGPESETPTTAGTPCVREVVGPPGLTRRA
jgi:hypothetical protein